MKETLARGASVSIVARRHNVNSDVVFAWRNQYRQGILRPLTSGIKDGFVPVGVIGEQGQVLPPASPLLSPASESIPAKKNAVKTNLRPLPAPAPVLPAAPPVLASRPPEPAMPSAGSIELQLSGTIKVRVEGHVDAKMLRNVLAAAREFT